MMIFFLNVVNIFIIYDLFYPPANNQNAIFLLANPRIIHSALGYNAQTIVLLF